MNATYLGILKKHSSLYEISKRTSVWAIAYKGPKKEHSWQSQRFTRNTKPNKIKRHLGTHWNLTTLGYFIEKSLEKSSITSKHQRCWMCVYQHDKFVAPLINTYAYWVTHYVQSKRKKYEYEDQFSIYLYMMV